MSKKELVIMLVVLVASGLVGIGLMAVLHCIDTEIPFLALGVILAVVIWGLVNLGLSLFGYQTTFDLTISMGCRRKDFIISQIITVYINMLFELGVIGFIYMIEKALYQWIYSAYGMDDITSYILKTEIVLVLFLLIPAMRLLLGALILRYKKKAFWILWAIWMIGSLGSGRMVTYLLENPQSWIAQSILNIMNMSGVVQVMLAVFLSGVMLLGTYLLTKKQAVFM